MNIKEFFLDLFDLFLEKKTSRIKIKEIIKLLIPFKVHFPLIRLGENGDGGYLIPDDLNKIKYCFSAGVGSRTKFENDLYNIYNIKSVLADPGVIDPKILPKDSKFINKKVGVFESKDSINVNNFIDSSEEIIFKMDIEGDEYNNLIFFDESKFNNIRILILEFHNLRDLRHSFFCKTLLAILKKINKYFYSCHIHANNTGKVKKIGGYNIPDMLEITFINKKRFSLKLTEHANLPHYLDQKIDPKKNEIFIDKNWFN